MSRTDAGFSVVELLVAIALFAVGAAGLVTFLTGTITANSNSLHMTAAIQVAQDRLEKLRSSSFFAVTSGSDGPLNAKSETSGAGRIYNRSWTVDTTTIPPAKQVTVTVSWRDHAFTRQIQLSTIFAQ